MPGGRIGVWDASTGDELRLLEHGSTVDYCGFLPDGKHLISLGKAVENHGTARYIKIWNLQDGSTESSYEMESSSVGSVESCEVAPNGEWIVIAEVGDLRVVDLQSGQVKAEWQACERSSAGLKCSVSPDSRWIASVLADERSLTIWQATTGQRLAAFAADGALYDCDFFANGEHIMAVGKRGVYWLRIQR
jgi:tricorn protease-like protein